MKRFREECFNTVCWTVWVTLVFGPLALIVLLGALVFVGMAVVTTYMAYQYWTPAGIAMLAAWIALGHSLFFIPRGKKRADANPEQPRH